MAIDWQRAEERARRAYEFGRARGALVQASPLVILATAAAVLGNVAAEATAIGFVLYGAAVAFHWRGLELGKAVLPGAAAGLIPLALGLVMRAHGCMGAGCTTVCIPVCASAGAVAGLLVAGAALRTSMRAPFLLGAGTIALLTGALGCACIGFGGIAGLAAGVAIPVAAGLFRVAVAGSR